MNNLKATRQPVRKRLWLRQLSGLLAVYRNKVNSGEVRQERKTQFDPRGKAPVTPGLRPGYDLPGTEKWANRRKKLRLVAEVVQLVAEVVGDRKGQISRNKVAVMFKTRSHRAYDQVTSYLRSKNVGMIGQS